MRPFIVDDNLKKQIAEVVEYAQQHVYSENYIRTTIDGTKPVPGNIDEHVIQTAFGYKLVFSYAEQKGTTYRLLSMSVDTPGKYPNPLIVQEVIELFGYHNKLEDCIVREESLPLGMKAIQVIEEI